MEKDRYTYFDWMMVALVGLLMLERLDPRAAASLSLVMAAFMFCTRLSLFLFQFIPPRAPWVYLAPAVIMIAVFSFGVDGILYYIKQTPITEETLCPRDHKDDEDQHTPLPDQLRLLG